jgi:hypothetical protein
MGRLLSAADLEGAKPLLSDDDLAGARPVIAHKNPQPRSETQTDEEVGIGTGPITSARVPGTALSLPLRQPMSQLEFDQQAAQAGGDVGRIEDALGDAALGGVAGMAAKAALTGKAASALTHSEQLAQFARGAAKTDYAALVSKALGETAKHSLAARVTELVAPRAIESGTTAVRAVGSAARAATPLAGVAAGAEAAGPFSSMMDRLRTAATGSQRAASLLSKIQAEMKAGNMSFGTGEVDQGTLGGGQ